MGDPEVVKAVVQGAVEGLISPAAELFRQITGGAAEEAGQALRAYVRNVCDRRLPRLMARSKQMFESARIVPHPLPAKILLPILENGSVEENDDLQDRWAALLVNCSSQDGSMSAFSEYIPASEILKQLNPYEVLLLQMCYEFVNTNSYGQPGVEKKPITTVYTEWLDTLVKKYDFMRLSGSLGHMHRQALIVDNLKRLRLIELKTAEDGQSRLHLTNLGFRFTELCQTHL